MVAGAVGAALDHQLDLVSFAPRFDGQTAGERFLQPALLATLVYRLGVPGPTAPPDRLLANGQCFLVRRATLEEGEGYAPSRSSFADDVTLARYYARRGARCGFLDGSELYRVRAYRSWDGQYSDYSNIDSATTAPCGPADFSATVECSTRTVDFAWSAQSPIPDRLEIQDARTLTVIAQPAPTATTCSDCATLDQEGELGEYQIVAYYGTPPNEIANQARASARNSASSGVSLKSMIISLVDQEACAIRRSAQASRPPNVSASVRSRR